jgi:YD repeat-containing protein
MYFSRKLTTGILESLKIKILRGIKMVGLFSKKNIVKRFIVALLSLFLVLGAFAPYIPAKAVQYINYRLIPKTVSSSRTREVRTAPIEKEDKRTEKSKTFHNPDGTYTIKYYTIPIHVKDKNGKWVDKETSTTEAGLMGFFNNRMMTPPTNLSLCLYAAGCSFDEAGTKTANQMNVYHYEINNVTYRSDAYLRYPELRDLIPLDSMITNCSVVTQYADPNAQAFSLSAYAILDSWNPATVTSTNLPTISGTASATTTWTLTPGSTRSARSLDITTLAGLWFDDTMDCFGVALSCPTATQSVSGVTGADLPVLVVKYTVNGEPSNPSFGGSYYTDNICPPVLIPGRPVLVNRTGDLANAITSWMVQKLEQDVFNPYCFEFLRDFIKFPDDDYIPEPTLPVLPVDPPQACSTGYFGTYDFPPLNGDPSTNADIYPNHAVSIVDPDDTPLQTGLNITVPGTQSQPFLHLTGDATRHDFVDVSYMFNTPVSAEKYPNYPINTTNNFTYVLRPTSSSSVSASLAEFPYVEANLAKDTGADGEKENQRDKTIRDAIANLKALLNPKDGNLTLQIEPITGVQDGGPGCIKWTHQATINGSSVFITEPNDPLPIFGIGASSAFDERVIGGGIGVIANPEDPSIVFHSASGSVFSFAPIYDASQTLSSQYSSPPTTDMTAFTDLGAPVNEQIKLQTKTGDITYFFSSANGYLYKVNSAQGGEITFTRPTQNPAEVSSVQTSSGYIMYATYDNHLLVEISDNMGGNPEYFGYDAQDRLSQYQDPLGNIIKIDYTLNNQIDTISLNNVQKIAIDYDAITPSYSAKSITDACNHTTTLTFNPITQTSVVEDPIGNEVEYVYYHDGTLASVTDEDEGAKTFFPDSEQNSTDSQSIRACSGDDSATTEMEFDTNRNLVVVRDATGEETEITYNDDNKPTSVTDREGQITLTTYTQDGAQPASVTYPDGRVLTYSYGNDVFLDSITTTFKTGTTTATAITRDQHGYVDTITDPMNNVTDFDYDLKGRLQKTTDPLGRETAYTYDAKSRLTDIDVTSDQETKTMSIDYDANDQITQVIDPAGHDTTFGYSDCGNLLTVTNFLDQVTTYGHDALGRVTSITDANNHTSSAVYNALGQITSITDPDNKVTTYAYDGHSRLDQVTDPMDGVTAITYDELNRVTSITNPKDEETSFVYNKEGYLTQMTDPKSQVYNISYLDGYKVDSVTGPLNTSISYEYYPFGGVKKATNALNQYVTYDYNENHQIIQATDIKGRAMDYTYDDLGRITQVTDSIDRSVYYRYDEFGNTKEIEDTLGNISKFEYDISNNVTAYITPTNDRYEYTYDGLDRVTEIKDPLNHVRKYTYDDVGNTTSFEDPLQHVTHWLYNAKNQLEQTTDALDQDTLFAYDDNGRLTQVTDTLARETNFEYDALGQLTQTINPNSQGTAYQYDAMGNLTKKIRPATATTTTAETDYTFDALNRLSTVTTPNGHETSFTYNTLSMITDITLPTTATIEYTYDAYNKLTEITASDNHSSTYTYDSIDRVTEAEDSIGGSTLYEYDNLDRLTEITGPDSIATSYTYDASSRMITSTYNTNDLTEYTYDAASRLTMIEAPGSRTYTLAYDVTDKLREEHLPSDVTVTTLYDEIDRPDSLTYTLPGGSSKQSKRTNRTSLPFTFTEFSLMLLAFKLKQSDLAEQIQTAGELDDASYKKMVKINNDFQKALMTPVTIASFEPTYDSESNVTGEGINLNSVTQTRSYTYDAENQLLTADTPNADYTYTYDQRNNRLTQRIVSTSPALDTTDYYSYNKEDELLTWERRNTQSQVVLEAYTFTYDNLGDCISQTKTSVTPNEVTEYEYYVGGNLKQVTLPDASEISYLYDANSNRIQKTNASLPFG